jgi:hypothetical protein
MLYIIFLFSVHLFSPFGNVTVIWISDISAFVALRDRTAASSVLGKGWNFVKNIYLYLKARGVAKLGLLNKIQNRYMTCLNREMAKLEALLSVRVGTCIGTVSGENGNVEQLLEQPETEMPRPGIEPGWRAL